MRGWSEHEEREAERYRDGLERLPDDPGTRQRQLVRVANAACGAGLACLMDGRDEDAARWFGSSATRYRESFDGAPPESWGRLLGAVKMRLLAGDADALADDARWALSQRPDDAASPIGRYAAALALLALGEDTDAAGITRSLRSAPEEAFPTPVAEALSGLATGDGDVYRRGVVGTLRAFEERETYLEDVAVADTVLALEALAAARGLDVRPASPLLPARR